ncbi:MAG: Gfo/Idh/MocA family protein, partial [Micromonosporaceae bacterium]
TTRRDTFAATHDIDQVYPDWRDLVTGAGGAEVAAGRRDGRIADAVVIATQDAMHLEPALAFAEQGYHILLEKPIAPTAAECQQIVAAVEQAGVLFAVGHVMRYTPYTGAVKAVVDSGRLGDLVSVQHLEPVGYWHQAHSFVRGNWRNEAESAPMLLAKSCHDLDWLRYVMGRPIRRVSSFGSLTHFTPANRPAGAADRCLDCAVEPECAYSAPRLYGDRLRTGRHGWPLKVVVDEPTEQALDDALRNGPYGRCVYACDNDVVDHQVVCMEFDGGLTGTFTMTAFTAEGLHRQTRIFGTRGELIGDGSTVRVHDFLSGATEVIDADGGGDATAGGGHGGGDGGLMDAFVRAVASGDARHILSGPDETLNSHLAVFAAEHARRSGTVVTVANGS